MTHVSDATVGALWVAAAALAGSGGVDAGDGLTAVKAAPVEPVVAARDAVVIERPPATIGGALRRTHLVVQICMVHRSWNTTISAWTHKDQ